MPYQAELVVVEDLADGQGEVAEDADQQQGLEDVVVVLELAGFDEPQVGEPGGEESEGRPHQDPDREQDRDLSRTEDLVELEHYIRMALRVYSKDHDSPMKADEATTLKTRYFCFQMSLACFQETFSIFSIGTFGLFLTRISDSRKATVLRMASINDCVSIFFGSSPTYKVVRRPPAPKPMRFE